MQTITVDDLKGRRPPVHWDAKLPQILRSTSVDTFPHNGTAALKMTRGRTGSQWKLCRIGITGRGIELLIPDEP